MDPTVLQQILDTLKGGHYLGLAIIATLYLRKLAGPDSKFPISIPTTWLPSVSAFGGLAYGFEASLQSGATAGAAALGALGVAASTGFFDGLVTVIFNHGNAPAWAKALVFLVDDIAGTGGGGTGALSPATKKPTENITPTDPPNRAIAPPKTLRRWGSRLLIEATACVTACCFALVLIAGLTAITQCTPAQAIGAVIPALDCGVAIVEDAVAGLTIPEIVAKEGARCGADESQVVAVLLESKDPRLVTTKAMIAALAMQPRTDGGSK